MKLLIDTYKNSGTLHHAYIIEGGGEMLREKLFGFLSDTLKHSVRGNPDFWHGQFETFGVDDARNLRDAQANRAVTNGRKIFVVETGFVTVEAQNALLKVFEEPTPNTHFFIILPTAEALLPTLRSRTLIVSGSQENGSGEAEKFLKLAVPERLAMAAEISEAKDKARSIGLINDLIVSLGKGKSRDPAVLQELLKMRGYLNDRSPSLKLILEHISLML